VKRHVQKVLIYATSRRGLLVFDEPDFPDVPLQVPGGTIEARETPEAAARREFAEETGLTAAMDLRYLGEQRLTLSAANGRRALCRHLFHATLDETVPDGWTHFETMASDGSAPIRFRFFWLPMAEASQRLGLGMDEGVRKLVPV
jgi:8-oxo-dGTP pyrophosphatase MutT (NUDIX family)